VNNSFKKSFLATVLILCMLFSSSINVSASNIFYGNADGDSTLSANDASFLLAYSLNKSGFYIDPQILPYLDLDNDGQITANDASLIIAKTLDESYKFPCEYESTTETSTVTTIETSTETTTVIVTDSTTETTTVTTTETTTETTTVGENSIEIGKKLYYIGQPESTLPTASSVGVDPYGFTCYSYTDDYSHYTKISVKNGEVIKITTFDADVTYDNIKIGDTIDTTNYDSYNKLVQYKSTKNVRVDFYFDPHNSDKLYSIVMTSPSYLSENTNYNATTISEMQKQILDMTNAFRAQHNLAQLYRNDTLMEVAQAHAEDMVTNSYFEHDSQDGTHFYERIKNSGINYSACAENINAGYYDAEGSLAGWIHSSGHRTNLLNEIYTHLGTGVAYSDNDQTYYYTRCVQDFVKTA